MRGLIWLLSLGGKKELYRLELLYWGGAAILIAGLKRNMDKGLNDVLVTGFIGFSLFYWAGVNWQCGKMSWRLGAIDADKTPNFFLVLFLSKIIAGLGLFFLSLRDFFRL